VHDGSIDDAPASDRRTVLRQIKSVEVAKLPRLNDRKIKVPPTVALIVVVGVEVEGASDEICLLPRAGRAPGSAGLRV